METQEYRIKRINPGINFSIPCSGGTDFWPINTSWNCTGLTMYQSTGSQIMNAIDFDMGNFPEELRDCSYTNPCVVLWDIIPTSQPTECTNIGGYKYVIFSGLRLTSGATIYNDTYNEIIAIYDIENLSKSISLKKQINTGAWIMPNIAPCGCNNSYLSPDLYKLTTLLTQDINDMGHYTVWDGNIAQKEVFTNFVYSGITNGWGVKLWNTTDFGYYASLQDSEYEINWGDGTIETLQYPTLEKTYTYCPSQACTPRQYTITISHQTPWGPVSSSKVVTIPHKDYIGLLIEPYVASQTWTGGTGLGQQQFMYTYTPPGTTASTTSVAYHTMYPSSPLDSGTNINQYSAMTIDDPCFTVSGVTDSMLGSFKQYTGATNDPNLPGGYRLYDEISIAGDVLDPLTDNYVPGILGKITSASPQYTGYTLYSYVNQRTPIDFYDFPDGITIFIAESCGLDALAFGGGACYECDEDTCEWCETKDEYIDRTPPGYPNSGLPFPTPTPKTLRGLWTNYYNYAPGDIVFDRTFNDCCCYMALVNITQSGGPLSPFANTPPALTQEGVILNTDTGQQVHVWEACSPDCVSCPPNSMSPCDDISLVGSGNISWDSGTTYNVDDYVSTLNGCYQALLGSLDEDPTDIASAAYWDYVGCVHWKCPLDPSVPGGCERVPGVGPTGTYMIWGQCDDAMQNGTCYGDRWLCENQFDCGACTQIPATHPEWVNIGPSGPSFTSQNDCLTYCKPPIYVCSARTEYPCCVEVICNDTNATYTSINNQGTWPAEKGGVSAIGGFDYNVITSTGNLGGPNADFHLTMSGCQGSSGVIGCCNLQKYNWTCELGCYPVNGPAPYDDLTECQAADHGDFIDAFGTTHPYRPESNAWLDANLQQQNICGFKCQTINSPCQPCFTDMCSQWGGTGFITCENNCSAMTECWRCDCAEIQPCIYESPCTTQGADWDGIATGLMGPDPTNAHGGGHTFSGTTSAECDANCPCDAGWDCWIDVHMTSQNGFETSAGGCQFVSNSSQIAPGGVLGGDSGWTATVNGPYLSFEDCCLGTDCCLVRCNDTWPTWSGAVPVNSPNGEWPCEHVPPQSVPQFYPDGTPIPQGTCSPNYDDFIPFCNMTQCKAAVIPITPGTGNVFCTQGMGFGAHYDIDGTTIINPGAGSATDWCYGCPGSGQTGADTCVCACGPDGGNLLPGTTHTDLGPWITSNPYYTIGDTVSYEDATNPLCCYICACYSSATPTMEGGPIAIPRQCGIHSPDLGPTFDTPDGTTIVNCWQNCAYTPSGTTHANTANLCVTCDSLPGRSHKCMGTFDNDPVLPDLAGGHLGGCQEVTGTGDACIPTMNANMNTQILTQSLENCFSDEDCYMKCNGGCFCEAGTDQWGNYSAGTSSCVTAQQYDVNTNPPNSPTAYGNLGITAINFWFATLSDCNASVNGGYDCCGNPRYNCLSGHTCSDDPGVQASQIVDMYGTLDACVPLYPMDPGFGDAQFRDDIATATTLTLCNNTQITFQASPTQTAAYNMCSWFCRWSCSPYLTPADHCQFVGHDPASAMATYHPAYNNGTPCQNSAMYTSAMDCNQGGQIPGSCFCNSDWVDCVPETTTTFLGMSFNVSNSSTCVCVPALSAGTYHTMDECQNPQNYPNVAPSCCDGTTQLAWCLARNANLITEGACDSIIIYGDTELSLVDTNNDLSVGAYCTDWTTNESGLPGDLLYEQYYKDGAYVNAIDISPNLMYSLQTQINVIVGLGNEVSGGVPGDDFTKPFSELGSVATFGTTCIEPHIPLSILNNPTLGSFYSWTTAGQVTVKCCTNVGGTDYIKNRVRSYRHEYLEHANNYLAGFVGTVHTDTTYLGLDYSNLNDLLIAAEQIGVTGLTNFSEKAGWNYCETCYHLTNDYYLTDIHEISHQITTQYYERIFPGIMGYLPERCVLAEASGVTSTNTAQTYMACVTLKTKGCCGQACFCTEDSNLYTWGTNYTSTYDPFLSSIAISTNTGPFIMDTAAWTYGQSMGGGVDWVEDPFQTAPYPHPTGQEAYGEGYYNSSDCKADTLTCCGQNTGGLVYGCTDQQAFNYDCKPLTYPTGVPCGDGVNVDDGSCIYRFGTGPGECIWGCFDDTPGANPDTDGNGLYDALNYNPNATCFSACTY